MGNKNKSNEDTLESKFSKNNAEQKEETIAMKNTNASNRHVAMKSKKGKENRSGKATRKKMQRHCSRHNIVVEDASESDAEDEDLNSYWCNRRPSPGQWMEPIMN